MPIVYRHSQNDCRLFIWENSEATEELKSMVKLSAEEEKIIQSFNSVKRVREFLAVRLALQKEFDPSAGIRYNEFGKPLLSDLHLSISHSGNYIAMMISENNCGIDIEE